MKKLLISLFVIGCLILTGCPSSKVKKAAETSYQFSGVVLDLAKATDKAFDAGAISATAKDAAVSLIRKMNEGAKAFNAVVTEISKLPEVPADKLTILNTILSQQIIDPFLAFLTSVGAAVNVAGLKTAIAAVRLAILSISNALGEYVAVDTRRVANV
jgi:hypothetical protein